MKWRSDTPGAVPTRAYFYNYVPRMAIKATRRPRNSGGKRVGIFVQVDPEARKVFDRIVAATGAPQWAVIEALLERAAPDLDSHGVPSWWDAAPKQQEALDISA